MYHTYAMVYVYVEDSSIVAYLSDDSWRCLWWDLLTQTPIIESLSQPIIAAATQSSPALVHLGPTNLFGTNADGKHSYMKDSNGQAFQKKQKSRKGVLKMMHSFLRYDQIDALQPSFTGTTKGFNTNAGVMCQIYIGFSCFCDVCHPFETLKDLLTDPKTIIGFCPKITQHSNRANWSYNFFAVTILTSQTSINNIINIANPQRSILSNEGLLAVCHCLDRWPIFVRDFKTNNLLGWSKDRLWAGCSHKDAGEMPW